MDVYVEFILGYAAPDGTMYGFSRSTKRKRNVSLFLVTSHRWVARAVTCFREEEVIGYLLLHLFSSFLVFYFYGLIGFASSFCKPKKTKI